MAEGFTRTEQRALMAVLAIVILGIGIRLFTASGNEGGVWVEEDTKFQGQISDLAADSPLPDPVHPPQALADRPLIEEPDSELSPAARPGEKVPPSAPVSEVAIDINRADAVDLDRLPGIGPAKAEAIIQYRKSNGLFPSLGQLVEVPGIGPATLERILPYIRVSLPEGTTGGSLSPGDKSKAGPPTEKIDLNRATIEELQTIPGIGPILASRIVRHRRSKRFRRPIELIEIDGIGEKSVQKMLPWVRVGSARTK